MIEIIFLSALALLWLVFASVSDLRNRIVPNWLNFSLIIFALGFRFFYSLFTDLSFGFFIQGVIGLGIFLVLGNVFYYGRLFAGGDAKLMIALGAVLGFSTDFFSNIQSYALFYLIFLFTGAFYGLLWSGVLPMKNLKEYRGQFKKQFSKNKKLFLAVFSLGIVVALAGFFQSIFFLFGTLIFIFPYLYTHAKAVDESSFVKNVSVKDLTEGDWLNKSLKIGNKTIQAKWRGLNKDEIKLIQKHKKNVVIKYGIPFVPVFLISFLIFLYFYFNGIDIFYLF